MEIMDFDIFMGMVLMLGIVCIGVIILCCNCGFFIDGIFFVGVMCYDW